MANDVTFLRRLGAVIYDACLFGFSTVIVGGVFAMLIASALGLEKMPAAFMVITYFLLAFGLFGWFWTHGGQTLGMRAWKIRVVTFDGKTLNWQQAFMRFTWAMVSWMFVGAGFLVAIFDPEKLAWHDRYSRTKLIRV